MNDIYVTTTITRFVRPFVIGVTNDKNCIKFSSELRKGKIE